MHLAAFMVAAALTVALAGGQAFAGTRPVTAADLATCDSLLADYVDAALAGDLPSAAACWRPVDLAAAARLGITYSDAPLKVDGDSPLWLRREAISAGRLDCRREPALADAGGIGAVRQDLVFTAGTDTVIFTYHFRRADDHWRLASPVALACENGGVAGRYVVLHDMRALHTGIPAPAAVAMLDSCVEAMADRLGMADADRERLERGRLGYLLADPDAVTRLAGAPTIGVANLQQDVVVTSHPCHAHELAHLVLNAWLRELPTFMLPLLQEGAAVHLGGRWGRHPRVLERVGRTTLANRWVVLDDLLTRSGFQALPPDLSYAPAGTFAGFILDAYGPAGLHTACLATAGDLSSLATLDGPAVQERLARALGVDWPRIAADFDRYAARPVGSGVLPGSAARSPATPATVLAGQRCRIAISFDTDMVDVVVDPIGSAVLAGGALVFGGGGRSAPASAMYVEHFPGRDCHGESHALLFTAEEAKLYDYRLQAVVALHAEGFWPSTDFNDSVGGVRFRVDRALWPAGDIALVEPATD